MAGGKAEVSKARKRLDSTFLRVKNLPSGEMELLSDFSRYLCVLVSGFLEEAIYQLSLEFCRRRSATQVCNWAEAQLRVANVNTDRLLRIVGSFDSKWRVELENFVPGARKDALDSVVALRNKIAHGHSVGVTYTRIREHYISICEIIDWLISKFDP